METSTYHPEVSERGFTLVEVLVAMFILSTGIIALSSLAAQNLNGTARSRYTSLASTYASEKLEDLNQWPTTDPDVCVSSGGTAGSLTTDSQVSSVTCNGTTTVGTMNYYDDVEIADTNGQVCETVSTVASGAESYVTTCHTAAGQVTQSSSPTANTADVGAIAFHRRWTIEMDQPIANVRRVTVLVTLENGYIQPPVSFQMSAVRP